MSFQQLNAEFADLRTSLAAHVGADALVEVSVRPPASNDEASFLRLVAWSYVCLFEVGRVTIPYLIQLPSGRSASQVGAKQSRELVRDLRTWSFHNVGYSDERGARLSRRVQKWFFDNGGAYPPDGCAGWQNCFETLCEVVTSVVAHCKGAVAVALTGPDDGDRIVADLRNRLDLDWPAWKFDAILNESAIRMGRKIDAPAFRRSRLDQWRKFLATIPSEDDPETEVSKLIERDLLDHFGSMLTISSEDLTRDLDLEPGSQVEHALRFARGLQSDGVVERSEVLARIQGRPTVELSDSNRNVGETVKPGGQIS